MDYFAGRDGLNRNEWPPVYQQGNSTLAADAHPSMILRPRQDYIQTIAHVLSDAKYPDGKVTVIDHAYLMRVFIK
jgi:hypothetical protein